MCGRSVSRIQPDVAGGRDQKELAHGTGFCQRRPECRSSSENVFVLAVFESWIIIEKLLMLQFNKFKFEIPEIRWDYSTDRVLCMEFCEGGEVTDIEYMKKHGILPTEVITVWKSMIIFDCISTKNCSGLSKIGTTVQRNDFRTRQCSLWPASGQRSG